MKSWEGKEWQLAILVISIVVIVAAYSIRVAYVQDEQRRQGTSDCFEQPSATFPLKNVSLMPGNTTTLYVCGARERAALPTVIQCYEMQRGCSP